MIRDKRWGSEKVTEYVELYVWKCCSLWELKWFCSAGFIGYLRLAAGMEAVIHVVLFYWRWVCS